MGHGVWLTQPSSLLDLCGGPSCVTCVRVLYFPENKNRKQCCRKTVGTVSFHSLAELDLFRFPLAIERETAFRGSAIISKSLTAAKNKPARIRLRSPSSCYRQKGQFLKRSSKNNDSRLGCGNLHYSPLPPAP